MYLEKPFEGQLLSMTLSELSRRIHNGVTWWFYAKLSSAIPPASFLSCHLECQHAFHHSFVHDPISEWLSTLWLLSYFRKWRWLDGKWTKRTAGLMKRKDDAPSRGRTRRISSLSATAKVKGSFSKSLVKSATYSTILSSVEVIHAKERNAVSRWRVWYALLQIYT